MRAYRRPEDRYELRIEGGRLALLGVGSVLLLALVFLLGVLVGKGLWGSKKPFSPPLDEATRPLAGEPAAPVQEKPTPKLTFYDDLRKPDPAPAPTKPLGAGAGSSVSMSRGDVPAGEGAGARGQAPMAEAPRATPAPVARVGQDSPEPAPALPAPVFTVQVGSFRDRGAAQDLARQIGVHDGSVEVVQTNVAGRTWYRVQVGRFDTRAAAETYYRGRLKAKGVQGFVTTR